jgi:hypothetical protein
MMSAEGVCYRICARPRCYMGLLWDLEKGYYAAHVCDTYEAAAGVYWRISKSSISS